MTHGPYFDKKWQRDEYEAARAERERELRRHGMIAGPRKLKKRAEPPPEFWKRNYTQKADLYTPVHVPKAWKEVREHMIGQYLTKPNFITGYPV